ncbi:hypothetical protein A4A49_34249 [Nicotiana attenuata]|uniref:Uncharacterized protein n=1 Tax=Nicotiana attenuata TaxID=49451 RepID=A0A1J6K9P9_NICAT|nr:hypothetical protein A4A49_34249 [Nicotiana attenuata]
MGLNESYEQARSQLLMMVPVPSVNKAYSMLMERESQRTMSNPSTNMDNAEMSALMENRTGNQQKMMDNAEMNALMANKAGNQQKVRKKYNIFFFPALEPAYLPDTIGALYQDQAAEHDAAHDTDVVQGPDAFSEATKAFIDASPLPVDEEVDAAPQIQHYSSQDMDDALPIAVRKPTRTTTLPKWMQDFVYILCISYVKLSKL